MNGQDDAWRSAVFPVWFALFDQRAKAFLGIFKTVKFVEEDVHGIFQALAQRHAHAADDGFLGHG